MLQAGVSVAFAQAPRIISADSRAKTLAKGKALTQGYSSEFASDLESLPYPFAFEEEKVEPVQSKSNTEKVDPVAQAITPQQILDAFVATHSVSGRMRMGTTDYLLIVYPDGRTRKQSEHNDPLPIRFPYEGKDYAIYVGEVTDDSYTFQIGNATYRGTFNKSLEDASIQRFNPPSE